MIFPGTRKIELETKNKDVSQYVNPLPVKPKTFYKN
jgi:hypothetical protein